MRSFLEEIDPDNIKFGGVFYHHKKIDSGNLNRSILRQSEEARKNKKGSPVVSISAILDKSQIGSGAITLEQITPE